MCVARIKHIFRDVLAYPDARNNVTNVVPCDRGNGVASTNIQENRVHSGTFASLTRCLQRNKRKVRVRRPSIAVHIIDFLAGQHSFLPIGWVIHFLRRQFFLGVLGNRKFE